MKAVARVLVLVPVLSLPASAGLLSDLPAPTIDYSVQESTEYVVQQRTGKLAGTVVDHEGKPVAKVPVILRENTLGDMGRGGGDRGRRMSTSSLSVQVESARLGKIVARAVTDDSGKFTIAKPLEPKEYRLEAGNHRTVGFRALAVTVKAGETQQIRLELARSQ